MSVRKDSESNGVGSSDNRPKAIVPMMNIGSCDRGGMIMDGSGRHLCILKSSFL